MIVSLFNQKGGVGKSTLAISLAWELMRAGNSTCVVDADPQATCFDALRRAAADLGEERVPMCFQAGENLHRELPDSFAVIIIDTPGRLGRVSRSALVVSDFVLIPVRPSAPDAWALEETLSLVDEAQKVRPQLKAAVVLTQVRRTTLAESAQQALRKEIGCPIFKAHSGMRLAWEESVSAGVGVTVNAPQSMAAKELRQILIELKRSVNPKGRKR